MSIAQIGRATLPWSLARLVLPMIITDVPANEEKRKMAS
jgi:hypothetical protein